MSRSTTSAVHPLEEQERQDKYVRATTYVHSIFEKVYTHRSAKAVDPDVVKILQYLRKRLVSLKCVVEAGPTAIHRRNRGRSDVRQISRKVARSVSAPPGLVAGLCGNCIALEENLIMKYWDDLQEMDRSSAKQKYIETLDSELPGWDKLDRINTFPISQQDAIWQPDSAVNTCTLCPKKFTFAFRRHHCRRCLHIVCSDCAGAFVDLVLSPGGPIRNVRVCYVCKREIDTERKIKEVDDLFLQNQQLDTALREVEAMAESTRQNKLKETETLRATALSSGTNARQVELLMQGQLPRKSGSSLDRPTPHLLKPSRSPEAHEQLNVANRQLLLSLKVAEFRARRSEEKLDNMISALKIETQNSDSLWAVVSRLCFPFLGFQDLVHLLMVNTFYREYGKKRRLLRRFILLNYMDSNLRCHFWKHYSQKDPATQVYLSTLNALVTRANPGQPRALKLDPSLLYELATNAVEKAENLVHEKQITGDVRRTFGTSARTKKKRHFVDPYASVDMEVRCEALFNVLITFANVHQEIGYCQGMNYIAALILSQVEWDESRAFWIFTCLFHSPKHQLTQLFAPGLPHLNLRFFQFERLCKKHLPEVHEHLRVQGFHPSVFASGWFMTLFTNFDTLPYAVVVHLFDWFMMDGWKAIFRMTMAVLSMLEDQLLELEFENIVQLLYDLKGDKRVQRSADMIQLARSFKITNSMLEAFKAQYDDQDTPQRCSFVASHSIDIAFKQPGRSPLKLNKGDESPPEDMCTQS